MGAEVVIERFSERLELAVEQDGALGFAVTGWRWVGQGEIDNPRNIGLQGMVSGERKLFLQFCQCHGGHVFGLADVCRGEIRGRASGYDPTGFPPIGVGMGRGGEQKQSEKYGV